MKATVIAGAGVAGLVLLFGLYLFALGARNVQRAMASPQWPKAEGNVTRSAVAQNRIEDRRAGRSDVYYSADMVVRYRVNGEERVTRTLHFGQTLGSSDESEAALQRVRFPEGKQVMVSYDPRQPWISAVRPGLHVEAFWLPGAGLAFVLPAVMCLLIFPRMWRSASMDRQGFVSMPGGDPVMAGVAGIVAAIFCALGILALTAGLQRIWRGHASLGWPTTLGSVVFAKVGDDTSKDTETGETTRTFSPQFVYQYDVDGVRHYNNLRRFGRVEGQGENWAREIAARYPEGARVPVSYQPNDPDVAVLEPGNNGEAFWLPGIGLFSTLLGLAAFLWIVPAIAKS